MKKKRNNTKWISLNQKIGKKSEKSKQTKTKRAEGVGDAAREEMEVGGESNETGSEIKPTG